TVLVQAEPVGLAAGDHLHIRQGLVDELPGLVEIADHHGLHHVALEGAEAAGAQQAGDVLHRQVDAQVRLVGAI
ncbi:Anaerobic benzoate catabolism transcriptional regulator, partial [Dysosmobacter welbionis]